MSTRKRKPLTDQNVDSKKRKVEDIKIVPSWKEEEYLAESEEISIAQAKNIIKLLDKENTIPFIARYRSNLTGGLKPEQLRKIKATYEYMQTVQSKIEKLAQQAISENASSDLVTYIQSAKTLEELEFIKPQLKKNSKRSLADRAKQLGLESAAKSLLAGPGILNLSNFVKKDTSGLENTDKVKLGIQHIVADMISKNEKTLTVLEQIYSSGQVLLKSKFKKKSKNEDEGNSSKYHLYGDFSQPVKTIKPHQLLAINRGESENELSVKIVIPEVLWMPLRKICCDLWLKSGCAYELKTLIINNSVDDAIKRLLEPLATRRIRAKLNSEAENEAIQVFETNLKQLLLTPPCSGLVVMGIDPGFKNGCKVAVVSPTGNFIANDIFFLKNKIEAREILKKLILNNRCETIALGNGTGCRETESMLSEFIKNDAFKPLKVSYTIINEQGVSIYSCSSTAAEEFPDLDPKILSAVSLARRLQNPLSELVKVEPKHLGVGMYQHDVGEKKLVSTLEEVVSECVSFVGVDINSASFYLLKRVAGLNATKAQEIVKYRTNICSFKCRDDLKKVKGIKDKTFQQCSGFIRVIPSTAECSIHSSKCGKEFNPLDETWIHPESYEVAVKLINRFQLNVKNLGSEQFVDSINKQKDRVLVDKCAEQLETSVDTVKFIIDTLAKPKNFDLRSLSPGPIFRKEVKTLEELRPGQVLEGVVRNVVSFGAFVDVGVGNDGLIHVSQMARKVLKLNDSVKVEVLSINLSLKRIELKLISLL